MMNTLVGKREREREKTGEGERERARERERLSEMGHRGQSDLLYYAHAASPSRKRWWELVAKAPFLIIAALCFTNPIPPRVDSGT